MICRWGLGLMVVLALAISCDQSGGGTDTANPQPDLLDTTTAELPPVDETSPDTSLDVQNLDLTDTTPPPHPYQGMEPSGVTMGDFLGVASHLPRTLGDNFMRKFELDKLEAAGVTHLRKTFRWEHMEPEPDAYYFDEYNLVLDECAAHGIDVMVGFRGKPAWATSDGTHDTLDTEQWAEFLRVFTEEVASRVTRYEIWNEANLKVFWDPEPNPTKYGGLLKAAFGAIHEKDDDAIVLLGGLSPFQFNERGVWGFLNDLYDAHPDLCDYFDALSIHPYTFLQRLTPEDGFDVMIYFHPGVEGMVEEARAVLATMGCPDKPIHLTEIGWPDLEIGQASQAAYMARSLVLAIGAGAASWYWYTFWDGEITPDTTIPTEERFGWFTWPNDETTQGKPSYDVLSTFGHTLAGYRYAGDLGKALEWPEGAFARVLRDGQGSWVVGLWRDVGEEELVESQSFEVPLHPDAEGEWFLYDQGWLLMDSGSVALALAPLTVELSGKITWLEFHTTTL